jgi:hypothetical protein
MEINKKIICILQWFAVLLLFVSSACSTSQSEDGLYCINCKAEEPDSEKVSVKVTINNENHKVPILIFDNKFSLTNTLDTIFYDTVEVSAFSIKLKMNKYYSVEAKYKSGNSTFHTIDGGWFETQKLTGCQNSCWHTVGGSYDLQLKDY